MKTAFFMFVFFLSSTALGTDYYIQKGDDGDPTVNSGVAYEKGNNIGFGTTNPLSTIHIKGNDYDQLTLQGGYGSYYWQIFHNSNLFGDGGLIFRRYTTTWFVLGDQSNSSSYFAAGNVGIGTSSPTKKLDVNGTGKFSDLLSVTDLNGTGWALFNGDIISLNGDISASSGNMYADDFIPNCPYPGSLDEAYASVLSLQRLPEGEYDPDDVHNQLDHSHLDDFIFRETPDGRPAYSLGAVTGAQNEVIKDLITRNSLLEARIAKIEALLGVK